MLGCMLDAVVPSNLLIDDTVHRHMKGETGVRTKLMINLSILIKNIQDLFPIDGPLIMGLSSPFWVKPGFLQGYQVTVLFLPDTFHTAAESDLFRIFLI